MYTEIFSVIFKIDTGGEYGKNSNHENEIIPVGQPVFDLYIGALDLSYPVVQGEDNQYYLHHTYEKTENFAGTLFADKKNAPDFSDPNTIIYGHNMKNGTMFGSLKKFKDQAVYNAEPYIWLLTPDVNYQYEIFSALTKFTRYIESSKRREKNDSNLI